MLRTASSFCALLLLLGAVPSAHAAELLEEFNFESLHFTLEPKGPDGKSSVVEVSVRNLTIEGDNAYVVRHCIDGDPDVCEFEIPGGNDDGTVTNAEVQSFQNFTLIGLRSAVPKVDELATMLQTKVLVDGGEGVAVRLTRVTFQGAEGATSLETTILAQIDARITYANDGRNKTHEIEVVSLSLKSQGFVYESALWDIEADKWHFDREKTQPALAKIFVNSRGYYSTQGQFENATVQALKLTVVQEAGKKKSPGLETSAILLGFLSIAWLVRRRGE